MLWQFIASTLHGTTPILLTALGGLLAFRCGIFHLGLDGFVCMAAFTALAVTKATGSVVLGLVAAMASGMVLSAAFWFVVDVMHANVIIAGLGFSGVGVAGSSYLLQVIYHTQGAVSATRGLLHPISGHPTGVLSALNGLSILTWCSPLVVWLVWLVVRRSPIGLRLTVVGDYPFAARSAGLSIPRTRFLALLAGGALCGLAGSELSMGNLDSFTPNLSNGIGYIAFIAVVFGAVAPVGVALASLSFGLAGAIGIEAQLQKWSVPVEIVMMLPYAFTLIAVTVAARVGRQRNSGLGAFAELRL